jgi:tetratricopeptide (TPR) repeat protein
VFSLSSPVKPLALILMLACGGCAMQDRTRPEPPAAVEFYTVTAELALARGEARVAALQYAAAAQSDPKPPLLKRAVEVATDALQPTVVSQVSRRWIGVEPKSFDAQHAAARAALALYRIDDAAAHYHAMLELAPEGLEAGFKILQVDLTGDENVFGARAVADRIAADYPDVFAARRLQGLTALRADDPAAAASSFTLALVTERPKPAGDPNAEETADARHDLKQSLARARVLAGDADAPLAQAEAELKTADTPANRLDYAILLMTAQREEAATEQLEKMVETPESKTMALRLLGLLEFQQGHMEASSARFMQVLRSGKFTDDSFYYLGVIADRNGDPERALRLYSQVQHGDNVLPALLRATVLLHSHGAPNAAEELLDRLSEDEPQRLPEILNARVRMYAEGGEIPKAYATLEKALAEYPDSVELRYAEASIYEDDGKIDAAVQELTALLKQRPDDPAAQNALGFTLADHFKSLSKARKLIERAHLAAPRNAAILDSLGWVLYRQGRLNEALPYLNTAYADDRSGDIAAHLGEVLWRQGKRDEAQHIWTEASIADGDNKLLKSTRKRLQAAN